MAHYGFIGTGIMGSAMAANLVRAGHSVAVWNRTPAKLEPLLALGATAYASPAEVVSTSEITFSMLADPNAVLEVVLGADSAIGATGPGRDYIEMSTIDDITSQKIAAEVRATGARFLEAPVSGTKKPAEDGQLIIMAAGDADLFEDARPAFDAMAKLAVHLGEVGAGARMKLVINSIMAGVMVAQSEGFALAEKTGLDLQILLELLDAGVVSSPLLRAKAPQLLEREYPASFPLKHMQKDLRLTLALADQVGQPLDGTATINQTFLRARAAGLGDQDFSAVHEVVREGAPPRA